MDLCVKRKLSFPASSLHMYDALLDPFPLVRQDKGAVSSPGIRLRMTPTTKSQAGRQSLLFMSETVLQASKPDAGREEWLSCVTQSSSGDNNSDFERMSQVRCCPAWDLWRPGQRCDTAWHRRSMQIGPNLCREAPHRILHRVLLNSQHILQAYILSASLKRLNLQPNPSPICDATFFSPLVLLWSSLWAGRGKTFRELANSLTCGAKVSTACSMCHCTVQVIFLKINSAAHSWSTGLRIHGKLQVSVAERFFVYRPMLYALLPTKYVWPWAVLNTCKWCSGLPW